MFISCTTVLVRLTFLDLCNNPVYCCSCPFGLSALLVGPVLLLLLTGAGGQVWAFVPTAASSLLSPTTTSHCLTTSRTATTAAGHLRALGTNRPPVAGITTAAGVWIWAVPLPAWPSYLGDDTGLNSPRTESGRPIRDGDLGQRAERRLIIKEKLWSP